MRNHLDLFKNGLHKLEIELTDRQIEQFVTYYEMLVETNKVMNLTAITEPKEVIEKHFLDSLSIVKAVDMTKNMKVIDIGTGAGFPGIPLKIAFPDLDMTLLDSLNKRIKFLDGVIESLGLTNIETIHGRSEEFGRNKKYREKYDICVSRAVANLSTLSEYCVPFVKIGGKFISYKAGGCKEEVDNSLIAVGKLGAVVDDILDFCIDGTDITRSLVIIEKEKNTQGKYPRKAGVPSKEPL